MNPDNNSAGGNPVQGPSTQPATGPTKNTLMAALAYVGPLIIVSYIVAKDDPFVKFHIKQGLILFVLSIAIWIVGMMMYMLWPIIQVVNLAILIFAIIGIVNAVQGNEKQLPLIGQFGNYFPI
jgi:uncharacterized membrane protein